MFVLLQYLFDLKDLLDQVIDDKEEEDNLEAHHHVVWPVDIAEQFHRIEAGGVFLENSQYQWWWRDGFWWLSSKEYLDHKYQRLQPNTENQKLPLQANDSSSGGKLKDELAHAEQVDVGVVDGEVHLFEGGSLGVL